MAAFGSELAWLADLRHQWLIYFNVLSASGSVREAAEVLQITPQSLNRCLRQLEHLLGGQLVIQRKGGKIHLSPLGIEFARISARIESQLAEIDSSFTDQRQQGLEGSLKIGWIGVWGMTSIPRVLSACQPAFAYVRPQIYNLVSGQELEDLMLQARLQIGIMNRAPHARDLSCIAAAPVPHVIVSAPQEPRHWSAFVYADVRHFRLTHRSMTPWNDQKYPRKIMFVSDSLEAILALCLKGTAAAYLPLSIVEPYLQQNLLTQVAKPPEQHMLTPHVIWHPQAEQHAPVRHFLDELQRQLPAGATS